MSGETTKVLNFPNPPRLTGIVQEDQLNLARWTEDFFRAAALRFQAIEGRLDRITSIEPLAATATLPEAIEKVNEIIAAAAYSTS